MNPPTHEALAQTFPLWLRARLVRSQYPAPTPHYETTLYGPINMMLFHWFSHMHNFMVKPQARVREPLQGFDEDDFEVGNTSMDSVGHDVQARGHGTEQNMQIPDWIVVKGTASGTADRPILIVEVKRDEEREDTSISQVTDYMRRFSGDEFYPQLVALLVENTSVIMFRVEDGEPVAEEQGEILDDWVLQELTRLVETNWMPFN